MKRRSCLKALCAAALGLTLAKTLPGIAGEPPELPLPKSAEEGSAGGYVPEFRRCDVLYGFSMLRPQFAVGA